MIKDIEGYNGVYHINENGDIWTDTRMVECKNGATQLFWGKHLKPMPNKYRNNYCTVTLSKDGIQHRVTVHRLVAKAFPEICGEWFEGCEIDHINGITTDNRAVNLRVTDKSGNMQNPITVAKLKIISEDEHNRRSEQMKGNKNPSRRFPFSEERRRAISERYKGKPNTSCWKSVKCIKEDGTETVYGSLTEAMKSTGVSVCQISAAATGRQKTAGGMVWTYC